MPSRPPSPKAWTPKRWARPVRKGSKSEKVPGTNGTVVIVNVYFQTVKRRCRNNACVATQKTGIWHIPQNTWRMKCSEFTQRCKQ